MKDLRARDYRRIAAEKCAPFSGRLALIFLILALILGAATSFFSFRGGNYNSVFYWLFTLIGVAAAIILVGPFVFGFINVIKDVFEKKLPDYGRMFSGFDIFGRAVVVTVLKALFVFLWSILFIIPGIIKSLSYSMADHIALDFPEKTENDCITESRKLMNGHKWQLFCMEISYIGWFILCGLTLGILSLWVMPKYEAAKYAFYLNLIGEDPEGDPAPKAQADTREEESNAE